MRPLLSVPAIQLKAPCWVLERSATAKWVFLHFRPFQARLYPLTLIWISGPATAMRSVGVRRHSRLWLGRVLSFRVFDSWNLDLNKRISNSVHCELNRACPRSIAWKQLLCIQRYMFRHSHGLAGHSYINTPLVQPKRVDKVCKNRTTSPPLTISLLLLSLRYDIEYLTCSKKLTCSQLSPPHGTNRKIKEKNELKINWQAC